MARCLCIARTQNQAAAILGMLRQCKISGAIVPTPQRFIDGKTCSYSVCLLYTSTAERVTDTSSLEHTVLPEGEKARYIRVQIGKQGFASIFEIEVYGRE